MPPGSYQTQGRDQIQQTRNLTQGNAAVGNLVIGDAAAAPNVRVQRSFVNSELLYEPQPNLTNPCEANTMSICILGFTDACHNFNNSINNTITIGGYCPYHNFLLFKRVYLSMTINNINKVLPFSTDRQISMPSMFLTSMLKIGTTPSEIEQLLKSVNASSPQEKAAIAKFYSLLSQPYDSFSSDREAAVFKTYVNEIKLGYYDLLNNYNHVIRNLNVLVTFSAEQERTLASNDWVTHMINTFPKRNIGENDRLVLSIPLVEFNMIDIVSILSYHIDPAINQVGYASNCEIAWGRFIHGSGQGIYNTISQYQPSSDEIKYGDQPKEIREAILSSDMRNVANLDVMVLTVVPNNPENVPDNVRVAISIAKKPSNVFDINKISIRPVTAT